MEFTKRQLELFKIMRDSKPPGEKLYSTSLEYVAIYSGWICYVTGTAILYIYTPAQVGNVQGACKRESLSTSVADEAFLKDENYNWLIATDKLTLTQKNMPLGAKPEDTPIYLAKDALDLAGTKLPPSRVYDPRWTNKLVEVFSEGEGISVHKGPTAKYLVEWEGVWFKRGQTEFLALLPVKLKN